MAKHHLNTKGKAGPNEKIPKRTNGPTAKDPGKAIEKLPDNVRVPGKALPKTLEKIHSRGS